MKKYRDVKAELAVSLQNNERANEEIDRLENKAMISDIMLQDK